MLAKDELGKLGEQLAEQFLLERGYEILFRNWRTFRYELDLIAVKDNMIHFVEVKTRKTTEFGLPEEAVDEIKISRLVEAGEDFLFKHPHFTRVQFDVLSICVLPNQEVEYFLIEDVYF